MKNPNYLLALNLLLFNTCLAGCSTEGCKQSNCPEFLEVGMEVDNCCFFSSQTEIPLFEEGSFDLEMEPGNLEDVQITWQHSTDLNWTSNFWRVYAMGLRNTYLAADANSQLLIFEPGEMIIPGNVNWENGLKDLAEVNGSDSVVEHWPWDGQPYAIGVMDRHDNGDKNQYGWVTLSLDSNRVAPVVIHDWAMQR